MNKNKALKTIISEGKNYREKLVNTVLLIVYRDRQDNELKYLEVEFQPHNYQHLTGVLMTEPQSEDSSEVTVLKHQAYKFYKRCIDKPFLTEKEILLTKDTEVKLMALPYITQMIKITKMVGEFSGLGEKLESDYVIGGVNACLGISKNETNGRYFPRSCLKENIKKVTKYTSQVLVIFQKSINDSEPYIKVKYVAKGVNLNRVIIPDVIRELINLDSYKESQ